MIKLLRKVRQTLLAQNKVSQYLLYAVGEILLVVIGIMLALNFNNRSEAIKNEQQIEAILMDLQTDLSNDIRTADYIFKSYRSKDSSAAALINNKLTLDDYRVYEGGQFGNFFNYYYLTYEISNYNYNKLMGNIENIPEKYTELMERLNVAYVADRNNIEVYNDRMRKSVYESIDYLAKNKDWYHEWTRGSGNDEIYNYYLNDPYVKNEVALYMNDLKNLFRDANRYRARAINNYRQIHQLLGRTNPIPEHINYQISDVELRNSYLGSYQNTSNPDVLEIFYNEEDQRLMLQLPGESAFQLFAHSKDTFYAIDAPLIYTFEKGPEENLIFNLIINSKAYTWVKID